MAAEPTRRDEFLPTLGRCLLGMAIAIILGCFIGYGCLLMIGQDSDLTISNRYLDRVAAARSCFAAQGLEYQQAADALRAHPGVRVLRTAGGEPQYWLDTVQADPQALVGSNFAAAIESLFLNSQQALSGQEDVTEQTIDDLLLYNIAVDPNGCVYFYLYYDPLGYICLVYDNDGSYAGYKDAVTVMEQWYLLFDYEGLRG